MPRFLSAFLRGSSSLSGSVRPISRATAAAAAIVSPVTTHNVHSRNNSNSSVLLLSSSCKRFLSTSTASRFSTSSTTAAVQQQQQSSPLAPLDTFARRHIGPTESEIEAMCNTVKVKDLDDLVSKTVPADILTDASSLADKLGAGMTESELLAHLQSVARKNKVFKTYIGMGYTNTIVPPVILRNILESPGWYTQYTPYQPEIAQGRLESLLNYQTMVADLTGLPISNASLLDEGTAAGEAMMLCYGSHNRKRNVFFVDQNVHEQTIACVESRAEPFGIQVVVGDWATLDVESQKDSLMGVLIQYPNTYGEVSDFSSLIAKTQAIGAKVCCATDLLALTVLKPPGEFGVDIAFGNSQRFGVPFGFGGPHAAFFATKDEYKRRLPGRLIGVSKDVNDNRALRLALQTREQHIRREKATSNICTAQALLANMAAMYAVYHGPKGLKDIATRVHQLTRVLAAGVTELGHNVKTSNFFDTLLIELKYDATELHIAAEQAGINLRKVDDRHVGVTLDESVTIQDVEALLEVFATASIETRYVHGGNATERIPIPDVNAIITSELKVSPYQFSEAFVRTSAYLTHPIFNRYHSETEMLRYIYHLQSKDLSLAQAMIPLGSCTMKLNATAEMIPVTWREFSEIHPFAPEWQWTGYREMLEDLEYALEQATGFDAISLQPNSGAQGEYAGLRAIRAYHLSRGDTKRDICLIPVSAHGTNPASAAMTGMQVVVVKCDATGSLDMGDLKAKIQEHGERVAAMMVTYPSTYGVFDEEIKEICELVHEAGGQVYMDGANLNAQIGLTKPAEIGADVCHMNLHKTFCIPHGGGGPGMGPIGVRAHLAPFLPGHPVIETGGEEAIGPISAAPYGSASILPISYAYMKMMGGPGLRLATQVALLNANYMMKRLEPYYKVLYTNGNGMCAHEFILDCRPFSSIGIEGIDIAKRLHDYGFHSPTMSFPVANTLMIEPTESESKAEMDRFIDAMISIRQEISKVESGEWPKDNNPLVHAPHPVGVLLKETWDRPYSREVAAYPMKGLRERKFWPSIGRANDTYGDRNLICSCPPIEDYEN